MPEDNHDTEASEAPSDDRAKANAAFVAKIERSLEQLAKGETVTKTLEELEEMAK
jgi:hypothetical protein